MLRHCDRALKISFTEDSHDTIAIPLVRGLMDMGLDPGAALAFMVAGGVTSIPAAIGVKALVKTPTFLMYLVLALTGSTMVGIAYATVSALM